MLEPRAAAFPAAHGHARTTRWGDRALAAILTLAAALRLVHVWAPPIGHHGWRQTDTAAIARNFVEEGPDLLHPRVDWRGATSGFVECEFPVYQWALAALYRVVGVREVAGRLLSIALSLATLALLYCLARAIADRATALWASGLFAIMPMPVFFGRAIMPDALLLASSAGALLAAIRWRRTGEGWALALSALGTTLACLIKPHTLVLGLPLAWLAYRRHGARAFLRPELLAYASLVFAALALWFAHAHDLGRATGLSVGVWGYGTDKWGNWTMPLSGTFWRRVLEGWLGRHYLAYFGAPLALWGLLSKSAGADEGVMRAWLAGLLVATIVVARGTFVHDYYLLPVTLPFSYYLGKAFARGLAPAAGAPRALRAGVAMALLGMVVVSASVTAGYLRREDQRRSADLRLAEAARAVIPANARVVTLDDDDPSLLYLAHRKGWHAGARDLLGDGLARRHAEGAQFLMGLRARAGEGPAERALSALLADRTRVVFDDGAGFIVRLGPSGPPEAGPGPARPPAGRPG